MKIFNFSEEKNRKNYEKIVVIGGGTGCYQLLKGLKLYPFEITAIVTMFDSGGSTGTLRCEFGVLPPGDIRKCLLALAPESDEFDLQRLFMYRFPSASSVSGHSFGNLFITALNEIYDGDFAKAAEQAGRLLRVCGNIYPVTKENADLWAILEDGQKIFGEANIDIPKHNANLKIKEIGLSREVSIYEKAKESIENADKIVIGPGDLYTSLLPNFLVKGMKESLQKSKARKIYVCNVMTKWGETNFFKASKFLQEIHKYLDGVALDFMICNNRVFSQEILERYALEYAEPVEIDAQNIHGIELICSDVAQEKDYARHDPRKICDIIQRI